MSKLDPKPQSTNPLYGWEHLNNILQSSFKKADKDKPPSATIDLSTYKMSADEIESEATNQGYVVSYPSDGFMRFE